MKLCIFVQSVCGACMCVSEKMFFHFQSKFLCVTKNTVVRFLLQTISWQATIPWGTGLKYLSAVIVYKSSTLDRPAFTKWSILLATLLARCFLKFSILLWNFWNVFHECIPDSKGGRKVGSNSIWLSSSASSPKWKHTYCHNLFLKCMPIVHSIL